MEEFESRPPFLTDPTRDTLRTIGYNTAYRDHKLRLPTPEKVAIMELSNSFERRRLGKQQQMLTDMNQRCREQEVADLSNKLTEKCSLLDSENRKTREVELYRTNFMAKRQKTYHGIPEEDSRETSDSNSSTQSPGSRSPRIVFDKSYKHFPVRKVMKTHSRLELVRPHLRQYGRHRTKVEKVPQPIIPPTASNQQHQQLFTKAKYLASDKMNGQIQFDHYNSPRTDYLAPLILPNIDSSLNNKLDSIVTARVNLGTRSRSTINHGYDGTGSCTVSNKSSFKSVRSTRASKIELLTHINVPQTEEVSTEENSPPPIKSEANGMAS